MIYVGIDPGLNGAIAAVNDGGSVFVWDTPVLLMDGKRKHNVPQMAKLMMQCYCSPEGALLVKSTSEILVVLESVHAMPHQGVSSSFSFGRGFGIWEGIIGAFGLPNEMPSPQRWKKEMLADQSKEGKDASRYKAIQLFPQLSDYLQRKKDDGRSEALLMAEYGRRLRKGN